MDAARRGGGTGRRLPVPPRQPENGSVTAEAAVVIPVLFAVLLAMTWLLSLGITQVRVVDAARETARAMARSESPSTAVALGRSVAPAGSRFSVSRDARSVTVRVSAPVPAPGGLLARLPRVTLHAEAVAAQEGSP